MAQNDIFNFDFGQLLFWGLSARYFACHFRMVRVHFELIVETTTRKTVLEALKGGSGLSLFDCLLC